MTTTFAELGLNEQILAGVDALGFTEPTPVQAEAIPLVLQGRDIVASAQTGTGKTYTIRKISAELVKNDIRLSEVLFVTYTEKAAGEMRDI